MRTDFSGLGAKLEGRLIHALYLAQRWGVVSFSFKLDIAHGFDAELAFDDAPAWRMRAAEFSYLEDAVMEQLICYVYEHRLKPARDPDAGLLAAIEQMTAEDFEELRRSSAVEQPPSATINHVGTWIALGTCLSGAVGCLLAMVLSVHASKSVAWMLGFGGASLVFLALSAGIVVALAGVRSPIWHWLARWRGRP